MILIHFFCNFTSGSRETMHAFPQISTPNIKYGNTNVCVPPFEFVLFILLCIKDYKFIICVPFHIHCIINKYSRIVTYLPQTLYINSRV